MVNVCIGALLWWFPILVLVEPAGSVEAYLQSLHGLFSLLLQLTHVCFLALKMVNFLKTNNSVFKKSMTYKNSGCVEER